MRAEEGPWPFRPIHITNDGETIKDSRRPGLDKLTGVGIISNEHLRGIETTMCANLQKPTTLIEFSPHGEAVRTDSPLLESISSPYALLPTCRILRETDPKYCHECDTVHASLFMNLKIENLGENVEKRIRQSSHIQNYRARNYEIRLKKRKERRCLEYDCPFLGYREIAFPIFFEGRVVSVFLVRHICLAGREVDMLGIQESFFKSAPPEVQARKKKIQQAHNDWVKDDRHFLENDEYEKLLNKACDDINRVEKILEYEMDFQREQYVRNRIDIQVRIFHEEFRKSGYKENFRILDALWEDVGQRIDNLIKYFRIKYVNIFGLKLPLQQERQLLGVVVSSGDIPQELSDKVKSNALRYDLDKIPMQFRGVPITSESIPTNDLCVRYLTRNAIIGAIEEFPGRFARKKNLVRIFPLPFSEQGSVVVLIGYYEDNPLTSIENKPGSHLDKHVGVFFQSVLLTLSSILAKAAQENMRTSLRVLGHEADQLNFGLEGMRRKYLRDAMTLKQMKDEKLDDICRDIEGYLGQLNLLFKQATQAVSEQAIPVKKEFWAYREILFKWVDMYRMDALLKSLEFDIFRTWERDPKRPPVYGDKILLEQLVYTLVSNAVKYCHKGTKIYIDCVKKEPGKKESPHVLTVINYGREFQCESPFELGTRGKNVKGIEGLGIGLYNAKRIADAHKASLKYTCEKVSDFNIPLIEPYIKNEFHGKDNLLQDTLRKELERLKKSAEYEKIIARERRDKSFDKPTSTELVMFIEEPTYEVKFEIMMPAKGE